MFENWTKIFAWGWFTQIEGLSEKYKRKYVQEGERMNINKFNKD